MMIRAVLALLLVVFVANVSGAFARTWNAGACCLLGSGQVRKPSYLAWRGLTIAISGCGRCGIY